MRTIPILAAMCLLSACGPAAPGSGGNANGDRFRISGSVSSAAQAVPGGKVVSHVMAVNPSSQDTTRIVVPVGPDGSFTLEVDPSRPWVLVFIDASQVGTEMIAGVLKASTLDSLAPAAAGEIDLGAVDVAGGEASPGLTYEELLAALGLDAETAAYLGELDDLCLRYVNPDINADGVLDPEQPGYDFRLDFHVHMQMTRGGSPATITDVVGAFLDSSAAVSFGGTGIYASFPSTFAPDLAASAWVSFEGTSHTMTFGPGGGAAMHAPNSSIAGPDLIVSSYGDYASFGVYAPAGYDMPQGEYRFGFAETTLTFTRVATHSDAELAAGADLIMPFVRFNMSDPLCSADCTLQGIDYEWKKQTPEGWVAATTAELAVVVGDQGGFISLLKAYDDGAQRMMYVIPPTSQSGTLAWSEPYHLEGGITPDELAATKTTELCHFGLSYDDKLGMRIFAGIGNAPGTCGPTP